MNPTDTRIPRRRDVDPHLPPWFEWFMDHRLLLGLLTVEVLTVAVVLR